MPDLFDGLIGRILAEPGDVLARLVFADWLEESGTAANGVWAEYIRLRARAADDPNAVNRELAAERSRETGLRVDARLTVSAQEFAQDIGSRLDLLPAANFTVTVEDYSVPRPTLGRVTESAAALWRGLPLASARGRTLLGMVVPTDREAVDQLAALVGGEAVAVRVPGDQLADLVARTFTRAIALVGERPAEVSVARHVLDPTPPRPSGPARSYTPESYLDRLIAEARARGATAFDLVAQAGEYRLSLVFDARPTPWMPLDAELGRELAELAMATPPERTRVTPRASRHGWGVRVELG